AWMLPVTVADPTALGDASGTGALAIELRPGLTATWAPGRGTFALGDSTILADRSAIVVVARARALGQRQRLTFWPGSSGGFGGQLDRSWPAAFGLAFASEGAGSETLSLHAALDASFDRPLSADGQRLPVRAREALVVEYRLPAIDFVTLSAALAPP